MRLAWSGTSFSRFGSHPTRFNRHSRRRTLAPRPAEPYSSFIPLQYLAGLSAVAGGTPELLVDGYSDRSIYPIRARVP